MKTAERQKARELRAAGWSVREIERELSVSRSSVSTWVRDVELGPEERRRLLAASKLGPLVSAERKATAAREQRAKYQREGQRLARERDASYVAGCMLFWAEGAKARNSAKLTNSDPELVAYFLGFLRQHFAIADDRFRLALNLFADHAERQTEIESFWLDRLALPQSCLRASTINTFSKYSQKKRLNKLPYGTASLIVHSTQLVQTIYGSIQEYGGFERPTWLD